MRPRSAIDVLKPRFESAELLQAVVAEAAMVAVCLDLPFNELRDHSKARRLTRLLEGLESELDDLPAAFRARPDRVDVVSRLRSALREGRWHFGPAAPPVVDAWRHPPARRPEVFAFDAQVRKCHLRVQFIVGLFDRVPGGGIVLDRGREGLTPAVLRDLAGVVGVGRAAGSLDDWKKARARALKMYDAFLRAIAMGNPPSDKSSRASPSTR